MRGDLDRRTVEHLDRFVTVARRAIDRQVVTTFDTTSAVWVDRPLARCSAWYELFPRSTSPDPKRAGPSPTSRRGCRTSPEMGFDVVYLPPIHPIGTTHRKGRNNATDRRRQAIPGARGRSARPKAATPRCIPTSARSPTSSISSRRRDAARSSRSRSTSRSRRRPTIRGSREHPGWFRHRPDGTIAYAENPPKRYEDIYPLDFDCEDREGLWTALLDVVRFWIERGVRVFRVDNPHTKPFAFWEWLIGTVHETDPDVIFLAEAFTRPRVMERLAKLGFSQSYTYFTWRNEKWELDRILHRAERSRPSRLLPAQCVAEHARHPARVRCSRAHARRSSPASSSPRG